MPARLRGDLEFSRRGGGGRYNRLQSHTPGDANGHAEAMLYRIRAEHPAGKRKRMRYLSELYLNSLA